MATTALPRATTYSRSRVYEWLTTTDHKKIGIMYVATRATSSCAWAACWRSASARSWRCPTTR